jgi:CRISPR-associated protein Cas1
LAEAEERNRYPAYLEETIDIGLIPHVQSQLMSRHLRGELSMYPPFIWR